MCRLFDWDKDDDEEEEDRMVRLISKGAESFAWKINSITRRLPGDLSIKDLRYAFDDERTYGKYAVTLEPWRKFCAKLPVKECKILSTALMILDCNFDQITLAQLREYRSYEKLIRYRLPRDEIPPISDRHAAFLFLVFRPAPKLLLFVWSVFGRG